MKRGFLDRFLNQIYILIKNRTKGVKLYKSKLLSLSTGIYRFGTVGKPLKRSCALVTFESHKLISKNVSRAKFKSFFHILFMTIMI